MMHGGEFHVDLDELHPIARSIEHAKDDLRDQCERMPHQVTDLGRSTAVVDGALVALLGGAAVVLSDLGHAHDALTRTYEEYLEVEARNVSEQGKLHGLDALFLPNLNRWPGNPLGPRAMENP